MERRRVVVRKLARDLSLRRRYDRLTVHDLVKVEKLKKLLLVLALKLGQCVNDEDEWNRLHQLFTIACARYFHYSYCEQLPLEPPIRLDRSIDTFCDSDCYIFFRFNKEHLKDLRVLLNFTAIAIFDNGERMEEEEVFLRGLYELASGESKHKIARTVFGRDMSSQSRAFSLFIRKMYHFHSHLVLDNIQWWYENGFFERSARAIGEKMCCEIDNGGMNLVSHFIDCNCLETERVGGGPLDAGANAARWDPNIQRAFYNGWKSMNGLKHQTVDDAYGFTMDCYGPTSLRRNDLVLLRNSDINFKFARLQLGSGVDYVMFGDSAYKRQSHIRSYFTVRENIEGIGRWNRHMKRLRVSIEWNYGHQAALFKYLLVTYKLKVLKSELVTKIFVVTTILRNLHTGYYGSQTSKYFNLSIPKDFNLKYVKGLNLD